MENYQVEDRLLENDFHFEAFEGLEKVPWGKCQKQLESTEARIINEFALEASSPTGFRTLTLAVTGLIAVVASIWYFNRSTPETIDLSNDRPEVSSPAPEVVMPADSISSNANANSEGDSDEATDITDDSLENEIKPKAINPAAISKTKKVPKSPSTTTTKPDDKPAHITVGRVVDTKGIPVPNAKVSAATASDTTDKSGYYALKIPRGSTNIEVTHLSTTYSVEVDGNQNWVIVLNIANREVKDYYPMKAANRFK